MRGWSRWVDGFLGRGMASGAADPAVADAEVGERGGEVGQVGGVIGGVVAVELDGFLDRGFRQRPTPP